jgi:hypothetical protein
MSLYLFYYSKGLVEA